MFDQYQSKADGQIISKDTDIHPLHHKLWETWFSEVGQLNFTAAKKKYFSLFYDSKQFFATKVENHHEKQHTPSES